MSDAPLCKDCRWRKGRDCTEPTTVQYSLVDGWEIRERCYWLREKGGLCGPSGRLFEPKIPRPWWRFW